MCGIVGYTGRRNAVPILLDGLARLEYRGYDSAGIAIVLPDRVQCVRSVGRVAALRERTDDLSGDSTCGIAHTRWATHGEPMEKNAHPHADCSGTFSVVHNGIIENYAQLKSQLIAEGHTFTSDTDTEVIPHLIEKFYTGDFVHAFQEALHHVIGAYGLVAISKHHPGLVIAARNGSPLVIGRGTDEVIVASDVTPILPFTREVVYLDDGEMAAITDSSITITDLDNHAREKDCHKIEWSLEAAEKNGYANFMLKEICEQPAAVTDSMRGRLLPEEATAKLGGIDSVQQKIRDLDRLVIVGMGTARIAGLVGEYMLEEYASLPVEVEFGSEFSYRIAPLSAQTGVLAVSQSGETLDTALAIREARRKGLLTLGIVNVTGSTIARETDAGVYNHIGPEIAVASTKGFVSQVTIFALLTLYIGRMRSMSSVIGERIVKELHAIPASVQRVLSSSEAIRAVAEKYASSQHFFFLGRKYNYPIALEGALKLKEIAYIHAEGYNGGEMKHGPISLIDPAFPTLVIAPSDSVYQKNANHIQEIKVRGGKVIAIATEGNEEIRTLADDVIFIPKTLEMLTPILSVIPLQLFAYYCAVARGCDVDKPRNLAKSVTVE